LQINRGNYARRLASNAPRHHRQALPGWADGQGVKRNSVGLVRGWLVVSSKTKNFVETAASGAVFELAAAISVALPSRLMRERAATIKGGKSILQF